MAHQFPEIVACRSAFCVHGEAEGATAGLVEQLIAAEQDRASAKGRAWWIAGVTRWGR